MARKMRKFSEGGALGRYEYRMKDIEKDRKIALAKGKNADVVAAKAAQRIADAKDDLAKRTGADRTATRAAERAAESNLTKTRKYGAPKSATTETIAGKITDTLGTLTAPKSDLATAAKKTPAKAPVKAPVKPKPSVADTARSKFFQDSLKKTNFKTAARMAEAPMAPSKFDSKAFADLKAKAGAGKTVTATGGTALRGKPSDTPLFRTVKADDPARVAKLAALKKAAEAPGATQFAKDRYKYAASSGMYAKGGKVKKEKIMKYAKGGSTPPQPTAAERKADAKFRESVKKEKVTPEQAAAIGRANRSEKRFASGGVTKEMPSSKAMGSLGMAKGGKAKAKPAAKGKGKPFAATKFGAALMKKSADTKGRAMPKFAKGGSIDGIAVRGKTKAKRVTMACGGMAKGRK